MPYPSWSASAYQVPYAHVSGAMYASGSAGANASGAIIAVPASLVALVLLIIPRTRRHPVTLNLGCVLIYVGVYLEKGMGLVVPGFIPTPIGEVTEYYPTLVEWLLTAGIWAFGFFILTILLKGAIGILQGEISYAGRQAVPSE